MRDILIIIPAYNEEAVIGTVLSRISRRIGPKLIADIVVIDDGSTDQTAQISEKQQVLVLRHIINRGLGAALATGFSFAVDRGYKYIVTYDADGQHHPDDIKTVLKPLLAESADVVIGSRLYKNSQMPISRKLINYSSDLATFLLFNIRAIDSQSGLRAFTREALQKITIRSDRMEVSTEIYKEIARTKLHLTHVPIRSIYTSYSLRKGQRLSNAPNVLWKLLINRFS